MVPSLSVKSAKQAPIIDDLTDKAMHYVFVDFRHKTRPSIASRKGFVRQLNDHFLRYCGT